MIYKGVKDGYGNRTEVELIDSEFHVYTNLKLREKITSKDITNQTNTFKDILSKVTKSSN